MGSSRRREPRFGASCVVGPGCEGQGEAGWESQRQAKGRGHDQPRTAPSQPVFAVEGEERELTHPRFPRTEPKSRPGA